jgi:hypothetical protein
MPIFDSEFMYEAGPVRACNGSAGGDCMVTPDDVTIMRQVCVRARKRTGVDTGGDGVGVGVGVCGVVVLVFGNHALTHKATSPKCCFSTCVARGDTNSFVRARACVFMHGHVLRTRACVSVCARVRMRARVCARVRVHVIVRVRAIVSVMV